MIKGHRHYICINIYKHMQMTACETGETCISLMDCMNVNFLVVRLYYNYGRCTTGDKGIQEILISELFFKISMCETTIISELKRFLFVCFLLVVLMNT